MTEHAIDPELLDRLTNLDQDTQFRVIIALSGRIMGQAAEEQNLKQLETTVQYLDLLTLMFKTSRDSLELLRKLSASIEIDSL